MARARKLGARPARGLLVLVFLLSASLAAAAGPPQAATVEVFGKRIDCPTTLRDGVLFAPVQQLGPALGLTIGEWDPQALRLTLNRDGEPELKVTEGVLGLWVRGELVKMRARPFIDPDGLLWAPVSEFCAGAGEGGFWVAEDKCFYVRPALLWATLYPRGDNLELRIRTSHPVPYTLDLKDALRPAVILEDTIVAMQPAMYKVGGWKVVSVEAQQVVKPAFAVRVTLPLEQPLELAALTAPPTHEAVIRVGPPGWGKSATGLPKVTSVDAQRVSEREVEVAVE